jgi:hypothetical protein
VSGARIVKPVDVLEDRHLDLPPRFPRPSPDQLDFDRIEEGLNSGGVITIAFITHRNYRAILARNLLIALGPKIRVMDAAFRQ